MKKIRLKKGVLYRMRRRRMWRERYLIAVMSFVQWKTGTPGRSEAIGAIDRTESKVRRWFGDEAHKVLIIAQKRAVAAFREAA